MTQTKKLVKGFTLIELVVVMAIIAILVALMVTAIVAARQQGNNTQITGNAKTIETALETYSAKNGGTYPSSGMISAVDAYDSTAGAATILKGSKGGTVLSGGPNGLLANQIYATFNAGSNYTIVACSTGNTGFTAASMPAPGNVATIGTQSGCASGYTVVYSTAR